MRHGSFHFHGMRSVYQHAPALPGCFRQHTIAPGFQIAGCFCVHLGRLPHIWPRANDDVGLSARLRKRAVESMCENYAGLWRRIPAYDEQGHVVREAIDQRNRSLAGVRPCVRNNNQALHPIRLEYAGDSICGPLSINKMRTCHGRHRLAIGHLDALENSSRDHIDNVLLPLAVRRPLPIQSRVECPAHSENNRRI